MGSKCGELCREAGDDEASVMVPLRVACGQSFQSMEWFEMWMPSVDLCIVVHVDGGDMHLRLLRCVAGAIAWLKNSIALHLAWVVSSQHACAPALGDQDVHMGIAAQGAHAEELPGRAESGRATGTVRAASCALQLGTCNPGASWTVIWDNLGTAVLMAHIGLVGRRMHVHIDIGVVSHLQAHLASWL